MVRWGIIGTGYIAELFAQDLALVKEAKLTAVGSRKEDTALRFAKKHRIPFYFKSYDDLIKNTEVDIVYIATPNALHYDAVIKCLKNGKHVLCEKPLTTNSDHANEIISTAKRSGLFLMEAVWTFFLPFFPKLKTILESNKIGEITNISIKCGFDIRNSNRTRYFNPNLGGGILLDMGIYPISILNKLFGTATTIDCEATFGKSGVDESVNIDFKYDGFVVNTKLSLAENMDNDIIIQGTKGNIEVSKTWWHAGKILIYNHKGLLEQIDTPYLGNGYIYEAQAVTENILNGDKESLIVTHNETLQNIKTMEQIAKQLR